MPSASFSSSRTYRRSKRKGSNRNNSGNFFFDSSIDEIYIVRTDGYYGITYIIIYVIIIKKNRNQLYYNLSRYLLNLPVKVVMQFF